MCYYVYMESKKRKRRSDRNHAIYRIVVGAEFYIGVTVIENGAIASIKRRLVKHWRRRKDPVRKHWLIYKAFNKIEQHEATIELIEVVRGKAKAHKRERELIKRKKPTLNSDVR